MMLLSALGKNRVVSLHFYLERMLGSRAWSLATVALRKYCSARFNETNACIIIV